MNPFLLDRQHTDTAPPRVLVVDDQPLNIQALYQTLSGEHQVFMATSGDQALAACLKQAPDLVLLDSTMPGLDGYETCRRLKTAPETRDIPVLLVTAGDDPAAETRALGVGAADCISRPINPDLVRARVAHHLALKQQVDRLRQWSSIDGLTGTWSRRHFDLLLATEVARAARNGKPLCLLLIDIDNFRRYNEGCGPAAGDACLGSVAKSLQFNLRRAADSLARYSGDQFACILPETPLRGGLTVARALADSIRSLNLRHGDSLSAEPLTVSMGVGSWQAPGPGGAATLLDEAMRHLRSAKRAGGGRACAARECLADPDGKWCDGVLAPCQETWTKVQGPHAAESNRERPGDSVQILQNIQNNYINDGAHRSTDVAVMPLDRNPLHVF